MGSVEEEVVLENDPGVEQQGALRAIQLSVAHWTQLTTQHPLRVSLINLKSSSLEAMKTSFSTPTGVTTAAEAAAAFDPRSIDERLYLSFRSNFSTLDVSFVTDDDLKNDFAKKLWMNFMISCEGLWLDEFNAISLLRIDCSKPYDERNTILLPRIQWTCLEAARNRELCNLPLMELDSTQAEKKRWLSENRKLLSGSVSSNGEEAEEQAQLLRLRDAIRAQRSRKSEGQRELLGLLQDLSHLRPITAKTLRSTSLLSLLREIASDEAHAGLPILTASRSIITAWKKDVKTTASPAAAIAE